MNFNTIATRVSRFAGSKAAFILSFLTIVVWAFVGPFVGFTDTWQLVINTGTTIITFLMVFLIQYTQNRDTAALHLKIDELIASHKEAKNELLCVEQLSEEEIRILQKRYEKIKNECETNNPRS
jgi:low affinity Fe/Cu permease